ncbi:hypothetical protein K523DRAFT_405004 [Schizophyllum commune Tattone D]|nr:hypothetical protein K523DRAFT_405004 [Schizophyllum commune Tattone D]
MASSPRSGPLATPQGCAREAWRIFAELGEQEGAVIPDDPMDAVDAVIGWLRYFASSLKTGRIWTRHTRFYNDLGRMRTFANLLRASRNMGDNNYLEYDYDLTDLPRDRPYVEQQQFEPTTTTELAPHETRASSEVTRVPTPSDSSRAHASRVGEVETSRIQLGHIPTRDRRQRGVEDRQDGREDRQGGEADHRDRRPRDEEEISDPSGWINSRRRYSGVSNQPNPAIRASSSRSRSGDAYKRNSHARSSARSPGLRSSQDATRHSGASGSIQILFAVSYMTDLAQEHWQNLEKHRPNDAALTDYDAFLNNFAQQFDLADPEADARAQYSALTMENDERFTSYIVEFEGLAQRTGYNEAHWMTRLEDSVPDRITNVAQLAPASVDFEDMKNLFTSIDNRYWKERHRKEAYKKQLQQLEERSYAQTRPARRPDARYNPSPATQDPNKSPAFAPTPQRNTAPTPNPARPPPAADNAGSNDRRAAPNNGRVTMRQLVQGVDKNELDRLRRERRCFGCKQVGHMWGDPVCPVPKPALGRSNYVLADDQLAIQWEEEAGENPFVTMKFEDDERDEVESEDTEEEEEEGHYEYDRSASGNLFQIATTTTLSCSTPSPPYPPTRPSPSC